MQQFIPSNTVISQASQNTGDSNAMLLWLQSLGIDLTLWKFDYATGNIEAIIASNPVTVTPYTQWFVWNGSVLSLVSNANFVITYIVYNS